MLMDYVQKMAVWAKEHPGLVWGWAATTWEGPPDLRGHQTSMHMTPLAPAWRVLELEDEIAALRTEIERLQKYAERYRWLRDQSGRDLDAPYIACGTIVSHDCWLTGEMADAAIDRFMTPNTSDKRLGGRQE